jgi:hypothetical protein
VDSTDKLVIQGKWQGICYLFWLVEGAAEKAIKSNRAALSSWREITKVKKFKTSRPTLQIIFFFGFLKFFMKFGSNFCLNQTNFILALFHTGLS